MLKLTDELTAWADSKDKTELDTTALAAKREGLVAQLSAESKRMAMDLTSEFVRNNGTRPDSLVTLVTLVTLVHSLTWMCGACRQHALDDHGGRILRIAYYLILSKMLSTGTALMYPLCDKEGLPSPVRLTLPPCARWLLLILAQPALPYAPATARRLRPRDEEGCET